MIKKFFAFTLGEILIALGVIGVVASLTLPQVVNGKKASEAHAQFATAYSAISKAITEMEVNNVAIKPVNYTKSNSFYPVFKEYFKITVDCGNYSSQKNASVCIAQNKDNKQGEGDNYKTLDGRTPSMGLFDDGAFVINSGMLIMIENPNNISNGLLISVDINGKNKLPNRWGYDLFTFELTDNGLLPEGAPGTHFDTKDVGINNDAKCKPNGNDEYNGITCAYYAATNQDYFKELYRGH